MASMAKYVNDFKMSRMDLLIKMKEKAEWVWKETLFLHGLAPETRLASSLSDVEILTVLFYSGLMHYNPKLPFSDKRDRLIISKGHGSISMYPILADVGFFGLDELAKISQSDSLLGVIPDTLIPGYETIRRGLRDGACIEKKRHRPKGVCPVRRWRTEFRSDVGSDYVGFVSLSG